MEVYTKPCEEGEKCLGVFGWVQHESNKLLWDISDKEYKNKFKRKDAYAAIATELGVNAEEVKKKIDSILAQYRREKKTNILKSGMGTSEKKKPWWGFPYLQFLSGNNSTPRETFSNLTEPNDPAVDMDSSDIDDNDIDNVCRETASSISSSSVKTPSRYSTPGTSRSGLESLSASGRAKRLKKNQVNEAYDIMKSCLSDLQSQQPTLRDDYAVYGENVANRLRKIKKPTEFVQITKCHRQFDISGGNEGVGRNAEGKRGHRIHNPRETCTFSSTG
ncbi:hypothetical protein J6590_084652, partial [Homalodisca vitripennis]